MTVAVKFVKGEEGLIEGLAIPFGSSGHTDLDGEFFTKSTDFCLDWFDERPLMWHHGLDDAVKTTKIGRVKSYEVRDDGIWYQAQLDKNNRYRAHIGKLIDQGAVGNSSGTMSHLIDSDEATGEIKRWPWVEESLTPTPASPDALQVHAVKSSDLLDHLAAIEAPVPATFVAAAMKALDQIRDDDALPDGVKFADLFDRLLVDGRARVQARKDWHGKSGRVLSAATRERLATHPESLRTLAKELEDLLEEADTGKTANPALIETLLLDARLNGVKVSGRKSAAGDVSSAAFALDCVLRLIQSESSGGSDDPDASEDQADVTLLSTARDALTAYIAATAPEVGSEEDLARAADEAAAALALSAAYY